MRAFAVSAVLVCVLAVSPSGLGQPSETTRYTVVASSPHDTGAFTQGLDFHRGKFYETTGFDPASLRLVELDTGEVRKQKVISDRYFGEGMTVLGDRLWWITWKSERAFLYDPVTFQRRRIVSYQGEGWGLTNNGRRLIMSNGTDQLVFRHPRTFEALRTLSVSDDGTPVDNLNELEWVNGEIFANVWAGDLIARIDPGTGEVTSWIDLSALRSRESEGNETNGIAYLQRRDRLFVTGKNWSRVYEIQLAS
jgi:glutamine cyclotransferase